MWGGDDKSLFDAGTRVFYTAAVLWGIPLIGVLKRKVSGALGCVGGSSFKGSSEVTTNLEINSNSNVVGFSNS